MYFNSVMWVIFVLDCVFQETSKDSYLQPAEEAEGHELVGGHLMMSPHQKWLASYSQDGKLIVRMIGALVSHLHTQETMR